MKVIPDPEIEDKMNEYEKMANTIFETVNAIESYFSGQMNKQYGNLNKDLRKSDVPDTRGHNESTATSAEELGSTSQP
jgi:hypothetical protein